jgi:hypothetical protein
VSGATKTATLTIIDQAGPAAFPANVVIDANQPGRRLLHSISGPLKCSATQKSSGSSESRGWRWSERVAP